MPEPETNGQGEQPGLPGIQPPQSSESEIVDFEFEGETAKVPKGFAEKVKNGALMRADYTRKTQEVAENRKKSEAEFEQMAALQNFLNANPDVAETVADLIEKKVGGGGQEENNSAPGKEKQGASDKREVEGIKRKVDDIQKKLYVDGIIEDLRKRYPDLDKHWPKMSELKSKFKNPLEIYYQQVKAEEKMKEAEEKGRKEGEQKALADWKKRLSGSPVITGGASSGGKADPASLRQAVAESVAEELAKGS
jgi:hypothetical protein